MLPRLALILVAGGRRAGSDRLGPSAADEPIEWQNSRSLGVPWDGRLVRGVQLPAEGEHYFTWDPVKKRSPNRPWRRWGSDRLLRIAAPRARRVRRRSSRGAPRRHRRPVAAARRRLRRALRRARPRLAPERARRGRLLPAARRAGAEAARGRRRSTAPSRRTSSTRFVRAGAVNVFVGPRVGAPRAKADRRAAHLPRRPHARAHRARSASGAIASAGRCGAGRSRPFAPATPAARREALVVGCIHGNECAGTAVTRILARSSPAVDLWVVLEPQPRRLRARPAPERPRRRPQPQLPVRVERGRPAVGLRVPRAAAALGAGDPGRRPADPADQAVGHDLVPPAPGARPGLGPERAGGAALRAACRDAVPAPSAGRAAPRRTGRTTASRERARSSSSFPPGRSLRLRRIGTPVPCSRCSIRALSLPACSPQVIAFPRQPSGSRRGNRRPLTELVRGPARRSSSSSSSPGRRPERTRWSSCVTGERSSRRRE